MTKIKILGTGPEFVKAGLRGTNSVIEELISESTTEIHIVAYVISPHVRKMFSLIEKALERGVQVNILINDLKNQNTRIIKKLQELESSHQYLKITDFSPQNGYLHAKVIISDRKKAVIGSANFSFGGMTKNYEIGVQLEGKEVWNLAKLIDSFERSQ